MHSGNEKIRTINRAFCRYLIRYFYLLRKFKSARWIS